jgi:hypothetical protein
MGKGARTASGTAEFFYLNRENSHPVVVFHHLPKTGGTSVRAALREGLEAESAVALRPPPLRAPQDELRGWYEQYVGGLTAGQRASLVLAMSHSAGHLLSILGESAMGFTIVREPVDRVLSRYYFASAAPGGIAHSPAGGAQTRGLWSYEQPLDELYEAASGHGEADSYDHYRLRHFFNGQARLLLEPWFDTTPLLYSIGPPMDADQWRERLFNVVLKRYTVGVQEELPPLLDALQDRLSVGSLHLPRYKANPSRPLTTEVPASLRETIGAHNWLDRELHDEYLRRPAGNASPS